MHTAIPSVMEYDANVPPTFSIQFLRDAKEAFGTAFKIVPADPGDMVTDDFLYSCYGVGYVNANRSLA